jgi:hypothetical protein
LKALLLLKGFSIVVMDDFKVILGLEFFRETKTSVMPSTGTLAMLGNKPVHYPSSFCQSWGEESLSPTGEERAET